MESETRPHNGIHLTSDLWLDQPGSQQRIVEHLDRGQFTSDQAEQLGFFSENGYLVLDLGLEDAVLDGMLTGIDELWQRKPDDLLYAYDSPAKPMSLADEARDRTTRYRIHDLHSHIPEALDLYLNPQIFEMMKLILGEYVIAIQSLFFEYGSEQMMHRDPVLVPIGAPGHLAAAWIALEDIHADSGALVYVPGSHRLPYYEFAPGEHMFNGLRMNGEDIDAAYAFDERQCRQHGLTPKKLTAKKGDVFIWHASLRHGGSKVLNSALTRKSIVVHYSTSNTYPNRAITVSDEVTVGNETKERRRIMETTKVLQKNGAIGFDNPMRGNQR